MAQTFTVNEADGTAVLQFTNEAGSPVAGPNDSVNGTPVVPVVTTDNTAVVSVDAGTAGGSPGSFVYKLNPLSEGSANVEVTPLANSDGSPINETEGPNMGQPFSLPAAVPVTVIADPNVAEGLTVTLAGGTAG